MNKKNKTAAFLVVITILFPVFHHETASHVLNRGKSVTKNALKIKCNSYNSNIKVIKRTTKIDDIDLFHDEISQIIKEFVAKNFLTDSLEYRTSIVKYSFWSKSTFS